VPAVIAYRVATGLTSLTCEASPSHRAEGGYLQCGRPCVGKGGQRHQRASHLLRARQHHDIVPVVATAVLAFDAVVPDAVAFGAAIGVCEKVPAAPAGLTSLAKRSRASPSCRMWTLTVLPAACVEEPAAPAGLATFGGDAAPCNRAGWGRLQFCRQCVRKGQQHPQATPLLRATQRHAIVPDVAAYSAASSVCERANSSCRPYIFHERCRSWPACRWRSPTVPTPAYAERASSNCGPYLSYVNRSAMPTSRRASSTSRHCISSVRGGATPSCRVW